MTLQAYQNVQRVVEDPRATEYRLFGQVTGALLEVERDGGRAGVVTGALEFLVDLDDEVLDGVGGPLWAGVRSA